MTKLPAPYFSKDDPRNPLRPRLGPGGPERARAHGEALRRYGVKLRAARMALHAAPLGAAEDRPFPDVNTRLPDWPPGLADGLMPRPVVVPPQVTLPSPPLGLQPELTPRLPGFPEGGGQSRSAQGQPMQGQAGWAPSPSTGQTTSQAPQISQAPLALPTPQATQTPSAQSAAGTGQQPTAGGQAPLVPPSVFGLSVEFNGGNLVEEADGTRPEPRAGNGVDGTAEKADAVAEPAASGSAGLPNAEPAAGPQNASSAAGLPAQGAARGTGERGADAGVEAGVSRGPAQASGAAGVDGTRGGRDGSEGREGSELSRTRSVRTTLGAQAGMDFYRDLSEHPLTEELLPSQYPRSRQPHRMVLKDPHDIAANLKQPGVARAFATRAASHGLSPEQARYWFDMMQGQDFSHDPETPVHVLRDGSLALNPAQSLDTGKMKAAIANAPTPAEHRARALAQLPQLRHQAARNLYDTLSDTPDMKAEVDAMPGATPEERAANYAARMRERPSMARVVPSFTSASAATAAKVVGAYNALTGNSSTDLSDFYRQLSQEQARKAELMQSGTLGNGMAYAAGVLPEVVLGKVNPMVGPLLASGDAFNKARAAYRAELQKEVDALRMTSEQADQQATERARVVAAGSAAINAWNPLGGASGGLGSQIVHTAAQGATTSVADDLLAQGTYNPGLTAQDMAEHAGGSAMTGAMVHAAGALAVPMVVSPRRVSAEPGLQPRPQPPHPGETAAPRPTEPRNDPFYRAQGQAEPAPPPVETPVAAGPRAAVGDAGELPPKGETQEVERRVLAYANAGSAKGIPVGAGSGGQPPTAGTPSPRPFSNSSPANPGDQKPSETFSPPQRISPSGPSPQTSPNISEKSASQNADNGQPEPNNPISDDVRRNQTLSERQGTARPPQGDDARNQLEIAANDVRGTEDTIKDEQNRPWSEAHRRQQQRLETIVQQLGLPSNWEPPSGAKLDEKGGEHEVWTDSTNSRVYKVTLGNKPGQIPKIDPRSPAGWSLLPANASEYLDRMVMQNKIFDDDLHLEGLKRDSDGLHIVTSQPFVPGFHPDPKQPHPIDSKLVNQYLENHGFISVGYKAWYHPDFHVMVADGKLNNFIQTGPNSVRPIDLILRHVGDEHDIDANMLHEVMKKHAEAELARKKEALPPEATTRTMPPPVAPQSSQKDQGMHSAPLQRRRMAGRPRLEHLPDEGEATERQRYGLLRSAVGVYQSRFPVLRRRFLKGNTQGRSGLECQFRDEAGRVTPASVMGARIMVDEPKLERDLRGLSVRQVVFHVEHALSEEVRHLASLMVALDLWEYLRRPGKLETWLVTYFARMWREDFSPQQRIAVLHAYAGNYGDVSNGNRLTYRPADWQLAFEGLRMFSQARAGTLPTEADQLWHWPRHATYDLPELLASIVHVARTAKLPPRLEQMLGGMDELMRSWHPPRAAYVRSEFGRRAA